MNTLTYKLSPLSGIFTHTKHIPLAICDGYDADHLELQAQIRSGDYFITLATTLDHLVQGLLPNDSAASNLLDKTINDLLYLQANFEISKKQKSY